MPSKDAPVLKLKKLLISSLQVHDLITLDLQKYILDLTKNLKSIEDESEDKFDEMRDRTDAYFKQYIEVKEG